MASNVIDLHLYQTIGHTADGTGVSIRMFSLSVAIAHCSVIGSGSFKENVLIEEFQKSALISKWSLSWTNLCA